MAIQTKAYAFKNQWLNMSLYFINFMYNTKKPFKETKVGKVFQNRYFRYGAYLYAFYPFILSGPGGWISFATTILPSVVQAETVIEFSQLYASSYFDDSQVCKYLTLVNRLKDNNDQLGAGVTNSKWLANGDFINTNFIKLDKTDIVSFFENPDNGFSKDRTQLNGPNNYMRNPWNSGNITNQERDPLNSSINNNNNIFYFLKGKNNKDIILYSLTSNAL
jgi:hypothetical protein